MGSVIQRYKYLMVAAAGLCLLSIAPAALSKQPNFLLVMADDMGWTDIGRFTHFLRYGYADVEAGGPTNVKHMANAGLVIDEIFGQDNDRIGIGYTWSDPEDSNLDNQGAIDAYYRVQLTPEIQIGPTLEVVFDPVRNQDKDTVYVWGFRTRIEL